MKGYKEVLFALGSILSFPSAWAGAAPTCADLITPGQLVLDHSDSAHHYSPDQLSEWRLRSDPLQAPKAVVLLLHGLNFPPQRMLDIAGELNRAGMDTLRVALPGHRGDHNEAIHVSADEWLSSAFRYYCEARARADAFRVPLHLVAHSLGGLVGESLLTLPQPERVSFDRVALVAPALALTPKNLALEPLVRLLGFLSHGSLTIGLDPLMDRADKRGVAMAEYNALFDLYYAVRKSSFEEAAGIKTAVFMDPQDDTIWAPGIQKLIRRKKLDHWSLGWVPQTGKRGNGTHHVLIDRFGAGDDWPTVVHDVLSSLSGSAAGD